MLLVLGWASPNSVTHIRGGRCRRREAARREEGTVEGKVERPVRYLRGNFVYGRTFQNDADLDQQRRHWLDRVANVRVHGTTPERPRDRFDRDERVQFQLWAPRRFPSLRETCGLTITRYTCNAEPSDDSVIRR